MNQLPKDMYTKIADYLDCPEDALALGRTCKQIKDDLNLAILDDTYSNQLSNQHWIDGVVSVETVWFKFLHILPYNQVHTVQFRCKFKDQGWGNRKGTLGIKEDDIDGSNDSHKCVASSPTAEHHETDLILEFQPKPGHTYTMFRYVGQGGGHQLFVTNPSIRLLTYNREFVQNAKTFQNDLSLVQSNFGIQMVIANIDFLLKGVESGEDQDSNLVSPFTSVGIDTSNVDKLNSIKIFFTMLLDFQIQRGSENERIQLIIEDEVSEEESFNENFSDESSF
jgi:hypothetical protein